MVVMVQHSAETLRKRLLYSRMWAVFVILWSVIRTIIIWAALGGYGFNPWIYLCIDLVCATIDAYTTPKMVLYFIDDHYRLAIKWGIVSLVAFLIPDIYIFAGTRTLPTRIIVILCAIISSMMALAVVTIVRKIRKGRAERAALLAATASVHDHA
jgi:nitrate reductase NapE component